MTETKEKFRTPLAPRTTIREFWRDFIQNKKYLLICFAVPALLTLLMYICFQVYPIGEASVLVLDLNGQYVYFFEGLRDILYGDGSLLYSFSRSLGGEFIGIFAYYLASPFSILVALFPKENITEALLLMFVLKAGACGLTFGIYIEATRKRDRVATILFSTMYALCSFAVVMQHNTMWIDNLILLPIILLGIENIIRYGKFKLYVISLALAIFSNFYIGFMMCIFVVIYYFYFYFSCSSEERNPRRERFHFFTSAGRMTLYSVITVAICAALLLCTYYSLKLGKTTFSSSNIRPDQVFDWLDILPKLFIGSYDTVRPEGLPFIYTGTLTLLLIPLYFFAPRIKVSEKIASGIVILIFLGSFNFSTIDIFWHGLQRPNWLNYRYSFIFCFFVVLLAYKGFENIREIGYKKLIPVAGALCLILLLLQKLEYENVHNFATVWLSLGIIAVYLAVLRGVTSERFDINRPAALVLCVLVCTEMFGSGLLNMNSLGLDVVYSTRTSYRTFIDGLTPSVEAVKEADPTFYRMEKTVHRKTNDNFALGMNGLSNSTSTLNEETIALLNSYGLSSKSHWSKYLGGTPVLDTIFGVKYVIAERNDDEILELYRETDYGDDDYTVWENTFAMSIAAGVSKDLRSVGTDDYLSSISLMNATVTAMLGEEETVQVFRPTNASIYASCENCVRTSIAGHIKYTPEDFGRTSRFTFTINVDSEDVIYMFIPSEYRRECYVYINGLKDGSYFGNESDRIVEIGSFEVGETITVTLEILDEAAYLQETENYFYYLDSEVFTEKMPTLSDSAFMIHEYSDDRFEGTINVKKGDELIYTSIPYDKGWKVYANGERVEIEKLIDGVIGFELPAGEYHLELKYRPDCLYLGSLISVLGILSFAGMWCLTEYIRKSRLSEGVPVYLIPDRGDCWYDDIPELPDPDVFEDGKVMRDPTPTELVDTDKASTDGASAISTIDENASESGENEEKSADAENTDNGGENQ